MPSKFIQSLCLATVASLTMASQCNHGRVVTDDGAFLIKSDCPGAQPSGTQNLFHDEALDIEAVSFATPTPEPTPAAVSDVHPITREYQLKGYTYSFSIENATSYGFPTNEFFVKGSYNEVVYNEGNDVSCRGVTIDQKMRHIVFTCEEFVSQTVVCAITIKRL